MDCGICHSRQYFLFVLNLEPVDINIFSFFFFDSVTSDHDSASYLAMWILRLLNSLSLLEEGGRGKLHSERVL